MRPMSKIIIFSLLLTFLWAPRAYGYDLPVRVESHDIVLTAIVEDGKVYLQLRPYLESEGYKISFDSVTGVITAVKKSSSSDRANIRSTFENVDALPESVDVITMIAGSPFVAHNMEHLVLNSPIRSYDNMSMMPLELLPKLNQGVQFDGTRLNITSSPSSDFQTVEASLANQIQFNGRLNDEHIVSWENRIDASQAAWMDQNAVLGMNLTSPSAITAYELNCGFAGTPLAGSGAAFVKAEIDHGVNAVFLAALAAHESAYGSSSIAQNKNNLFGWGASDGNAYGGAKSFSSFEECINVVGAAIASEYLSPSGRYYSGTCLPAVNSIYCTTPEWSYDVSNIMLKINLAAVESTPGI